MDKVKSTQPEESVFNGFKHPMLKLLLKGTGEQPDMRHLRGVIEEILSESVDTNFRLDAAAELERLIPNDNDQTSSRQALLEEAFAEMARRFPLPRVTELLCQTYLQAGKVRIGFDDNISVHQDMPSFWRSGSGIDLHEVRPPTRCLNAWACAVVAPVWTGTQGIRFPFAAWGNGSSLPWYDAYNASKHDRHAEFSRATFGHLIDACCGLVVLLTAQFLSDDFSGQIYWEREPATDGTERAIGGYFRVAFPQDWAPAEMYDFKWEAIKNEPDPFQNFDYSTI